MTWLKEAEKCYKVNINGKQFCLPENKVCHIIRNRLKQSRIVQKAFATYNISLDKLDSLEIKIKPLKGTYGMTDKDQMILNENIFREGDFFENYMFVPIHEIAHYLTRLKEERAFFNDPEEVLGFVLAIAHYLEEGRGIQEVWRDIFPKIKWHFHGEDDAETFFKRCILKAQKFVD